MSRLAGRLRCWSPFNHVDVNQLLANKYHIAERKKEMNLIRILPLNTGYRHVGRWFCLLAEGIYICERLKRFEPPTVLDNGRFSE